MKKILLCLVWLLPATGFAQRISVQSPPAKDDFTALYVPFERQLSSSIQGTITLVPGRFGKGAHVGNGGLALPADVLDVNSGTIEFWLKVNDAAWFARDHTLVGNEVGHGQKGNLRLWYWIWQGKGHLRFDLHNIEPLHESYVIFPYPQDAGWHHVAAAWDREEGLTLFIDGAAVAYKKAAWVPVQASFKSVQVCPEAANAWIDELRISKVPRRGPADRMVSYTITADPAIVQASQTVLPVTFAFRNTGRLAQPLSGEVRVVDYYQRTLARQSVTGLLKGSETKRILCPVPTDEAGPYIKAVVSATEGTQGNQFPLDDEQIFFTDVRTGPRLHMSLNGSWETCPGDSLKVAVPAGPWQSCELPYRWDSWQGDHTRWFRKRVALPGEMRGKTIELNLSGVRFRVAVFLNGRFLGRSDTDQMPVRFDLTAAARPGQSNELCLAVTDWVSCAAPELMPSLLAVWSSAWMQGREIPGMPFIRPCTCGIGGAGISDPVFITATGQVAVENCLVTPSLEKSQLGVSVCLQNRSAADQAARLKLTVFGKDVLLPLTLKPGRNRIDQCIPVDRKTITLWWPWKPHLYRLGVEVFQNGRLIDRCGARFGFREFRADGPVFRINGVPIKPNAAAAIPYEFPALADYGDTSTVKYWYRAKKFLRSFADVNVNLLRYHTEPCPILMFDLADELGLMVVSEAYMATLPGKLKMDDERLWKNLAAFYPKWVTREFNHPSLVIRSMENELGYHLPAPGQPRSPWGYSNHVVQSITRHMKELGQTVKKLDPSRPIMYEGSGPIFYDVADIYNIHYPGIPGYSNLYPITGRRLSIPSDSYILKNWLWDRKKPLYVGEYDCYFGPPQGLAGIVGNDAYVNGYMHRANAVIWSYTIPGQRIDGMTAGVPWSILAFNNIGTELNESNWKLRLFKELTAPVAGFIHQYRACYFGGRTVPRTITTLNDTLQSQAITVRWKVCRAGGPAVHEGQITLTLAPAESRQSQIQLPLPDVSMPDTYKLIVETLAGKAPVHWDERELILFPDILPQLNLSSRFASLGLSHDVFSKLKVNVASLEARSLNLSGIDVLLVSGNSKALGGRAAQIEQFLRSGGRLVLFGGAEAPDYLPVHLPIAPGGPPFSFKSDAPPGTVCTIPRPDSSTTIVHPRMPEHPLMKDLDANRLRFWRENHLTADYTYLKPVEFSAKAVLDCGDGLRQTPLLEVPHGRGIILAVQLPVLETFFDQPAARILLGNILRYTDTYRGQLPRSAVGVLAGPQSSVPGFLKTLGIEPYLLTGKLRKITDLSAYAVLIVDPDGPVFKELADRRKTIADYVNNGGILWLHRPLPRHTAEVNSFLPVPVRINDLALKDPIHVPSRDLLAGVSNDELFWAEGAFLPSASPRVATGIIEAGDNASNILPLAEPAVAAAIRQGKGEWLIDEVAWDTEFSERSRALQFVRTILTNAGLQLRPGPKREAVKFEPALGLRPVDIAPWCNEGFLDGVWNGPSMGLHGLPVGRQIFNGVLYRVIDPKTNAGKSCIGFFSRGHNKTGVKSVTIPIGTPAAGLHLLVSSVWTSSLPAMTRILDLDIEYADGTHKQTDIRYGRDVMDWCPEDVNATRSHPALAWIGPQWPNPGLYEFLWLNPEPGKTIKHLRLSAAHDGGFAVLVALSTQSRLSAKQKKVSDWIPGLER
jgi:hypothetical protein